LPPRSEWKERVPHKCFVVFASALTTAFEAIELPLGRGMLRMPRQFWYEGSGEGRGPSSLEEKQKAEATGWLALVQKDSSNVTTGRRFVLKYLCDNGRR
jgi:hypothetical protein